MHVVVHMRKTLVPWLRFQPSMIILFPVYRNPCVSAMRWMEPWRSFAPADVQGREGKASRRASMIAAARNPPRSVASSVTVFIRLAQATDSLPIHSRRASTSREGLACSEDESRPPMVAGAPAHE